MGGRSSEGDRNRGASFNTRDQRHAAMAGASAEQVGAHLREQAAENAPATGVMHTVFDASDHIARN